MKGTGVSDESDQTRAQFESWANTVHATAAYTSASGRYFDLTWQIAWQAWEKATALASPVSGDQTRNALKELHDAVVLRMASGGDEADSETWQRNLTRLLAATAAARYALASPVSGAPTPDELNEWLSAMETGATFQQRLEAWNSLRDYFSPLASGAPIPPMTTEHDDCVRELQRRHDLALARLHKAVRDVMDAAPVTPPPPVEPLTKQQQALLKADAYLQLGGLWNPELMPHDKVRDMVIQLRDALISAPVEPCEWRDCGDHGRVFHAGCKERWDSYWVERDKVVEFKFCHYCGRPLVILPTEPHA